MGLSRTFGASRTFGLPRTSRMGPKVAPRSVLPFLSMIPAEHKRARTWGPLAGALILHILGFALLPELFPSHPFVAHSLPILLSGLGFTGALALAIHDARRYRSAFKRAKRANERLALALEDLHRLGGLVKRCSWCDRVSVAGGRWIDLSLLVVKLDDLEISHGICPGCEQLVFPELDLGEPPRTSRPG